jgi:hypothetical protein
MALAQGRSLPPAWTLVTPYCKRTRPRREANTKAAGSTSHAYLPPAAFPPSRSASRRPIWAGARGDNLLVGPGTPRGRNADTILDHLAMIKQHNDHIAKLDAKIAEHELENENFKFARSMLYSERRPGIKDGIGFQQGYNVKLNAPPKRLSNFVKGKAPMPQDNEGYILYPAGYPENKIRRIHAKKTHSVSHHAFIYKNEASSSRRSTHVKMPKKKSPSASNDHNISFKTFDASYVLTNKSGKVVAKYVGGKHKGSKTCVWVPKVFVSNVKGPKTIWVSKNKA